MTEIEEIYEKAVSDVKAREPSPEAYEIHPDGYRVGYFEARLEWQRESCTKLLTLRELL